jgi:hypothetical protein
MNSVAKIKENSVKTAPKEPQFSETEQKQTNAFSERLLV